MRLTGRHACELAEKRRLMLAESVPRAYPGMTWTAKVSGGSGPARSLQHLDHATFPAEAPNCSLSSGSRTRSRRPSSAWSRSSGKSIDSMWWSPWSTIVRLSRRLCRGFGLDRKAPHGRRTNSRSRRSVQLRENQQWGGRAAGEDRDLILLLNNDVELTHPSAFKPWPCSCLPTRHRLHRDQVVLPRPRRSSTAESGSGRYCAARASTISSTPDPPPSSWMPSFQPGSDLRLRDDSPRDLREAWVAWRKSSVPTATATLTPACEPWKLDTATITWVASLASIMKANRGVSRTRTWKPVPCMSDKVGRSRHGGCDNCIRSHRHAWPL